MSRLIAFIGCLLVCTQVAWGHAALVATSPSPGAELQHAPSSIVLSFSEPVGVTALQFFGPDGRKLATGAVADHDREVRIALPGDSAAQGTYLLSWRVVSADGHPVGGTLDYSIGQPSASGAAPQATSSADALKSAIWLARWLSYLCLFAAAGAALFRMVKPSDAQAWVRPGIVLGLVLLPVNLGLQGLDMRGSSWGGLIETATWTQALSSTYAYTLGLDALALLAALVALTLRRGVLWRVLALAALGLTGLAMAVSGHAGTAPPHWLSRSAVTLHVMMAIAWVGLLVPLVRSLRANNAAAARLKGRSVAASSSGLAPLATFSRWITPAVTLLVLSGLTLVWLQFDRLDDLWQTGYGRVLAVKLFLVGLLLCLAAYNRWGLTRAVLQGVPAARRRLGATIRAEAVLAVLILAVVSLWRFTPPPRSADIAQTAMPAAVSLADSRVRASVIPAASGWRVELSKPDGGAFDAQGVTLSLSSTAAGIEPLRRKARRQADGTWIVAMPLLSPDIPWRVGMTVLVDDFDQITLQSGAPSADAHGHDEHGHDEHGAHSAADGTDFTAQIARATPASTLEVSGCWVRLLPPPVPSAAYFVVENSGDAPATLQAAGTAAFGSVTLHQTRDEGGMSTMQAAGALAIPAHGRLAFAPGGYHVMLEAPAGNLAVGDTIELRLLFGDARYVATRCEVKPPTFLGR